MCAVDEGAAADPRSGGPGTSSGVVGVAVRKIKTRGLKEFASERLPRGSVLRDLLLNEKDELTPEEFFSKMDVWLRVFSWEFSRRNEAAPGYPK